MCRPPRGGLAFHARGEKCGLAPLLAALAVALVVFLPGQNAAPQAPPAPPAPQPAPTEHLPISVEVLTSVVKDTEGKIIETKITGLKVKIMGIPPELVGDKPFTPDGRLSECSIDVFHQDAQGVVITQKIECRATATGKIPVSMEVIVEFALIPNAGLWRVDVTLTKGDKTGHGEQVVNINKELRALQLEEQRNGYLRLLTEIKAAVAAFQKIYEAFQRDKKTGEKFDPAEWEQKTAAEIQKITDAEGRIRNIYMVAVFEKTRVAFNDALIQLFDLRQAYENSLKGAERVTREIFESLTPEERKAAFAAHDIDPNDPDAMKKAEIIVKEKNETRLEAANVGMKKTINRYNFELGTAIITAKHLAEDLALIWSLTDELFNAYKDNAVGFVPPPAGTPWMEPWLKQVDFLDKTVSAKYKRNDEAAGIQNIYSDLPKRFQEAAKALRSLRGQLLLDLYERNKIPAAARENIAPAGDPLTDLADSYKSLKEVVDKERDQYVPPTLAILGELDTMRKDLEKPLPDGLAGEALKKFIKAKIVLADNVLERASAIFDMELYSYTLPDDVQRNIHGLHGRIVFMIPFFIVSDPNKEEAKTLRTQLLEAYDNYGKVTRELLENSLKVEKLPEKPELK